MNDQDETTEELVDRADFPISTILGKPMDYQQVLQADFVDLLGASQMSEEEKKQLYEKAAATIENRVIARIFDSLTEEELEEWEQIPVEDAEALRAYLEDHDIFMDKLCVEEALAYKAEVASLAHQLKLN